jgi:hypothetical protein
MTQRSDWTALGAFLAGELVDFEMARAGAIAGLTLAALGAPQTHVKGALPAVRSMSNLKADDERAEFWERKPHRHLALQHTTLDAAVRFMPFRNFPGAFTSDDEYGFGAIRLCCAQKTCQRRVCLCLREAMQVETRVNRLAAPRDALA